VCGIESLLHMCAAGLSSPLFFCCLPSPYWSMSVWFFSWPHLPKPGCSSDVCRDLCLFEPL
jgi:hypothetical protein